MHPRMRLAALAVLSTIFQLAERTYANPYGYYLPYSRSRRDPTAWGGGGYGGAVQPNPVPMIPSAMGAVPYGGHVDNQGIGMGGGYGQQDASMYGGNQYGSMDSSPVNPMMGRMDSTSQHASVAGSRNPSDLSGYQQPQPQQYPSRLGNVGSEGAGADTQTPDGCSAVTCESLASCINVRMNETQCCPTCTQYGCICEGYQVYDCQKNGFGDGMVPEGKSYTVAGGTTVCSCPPGGGAITCSSQRDPSSAACPDLAPNCVKSFVRSFDGCTECSMVGCTTDTGEHVEAGMTADKPPCSTCYCPPGGGDLICGVDPACEAKVKQQGTGSLAMESTVREVNSMGSEANLYGGYGSYGGYPDYTGQYGAQNPSAGGGSSPIIPPVLPLPGSESASSKDSKASVDGQGAGSDSASYNPYGGYQQGYGSMGYQNMYNSYGNMGYGGNYLGYGGSYGYNGYGQTGRDVAKGSDPSSSQQGGGYGQYGQQQPYAPSLMSGYPSFTGQSGGTTDEGTKKSAGSTDVGSDTKSDSGSDTAGSRGLGYPYGGYGQGGYYQSDSYGQYGQGYPFQQQLPAGTGQGPSSPQQPPDAGADKSTSKDKEGESTSSHLGGGGQQGYPGGYGQYFGGYNGYNGFGFPSQYGYPHQQPPVGSLGVGSQFGSQATGQVGSDPNVIPSEPENTPSNPPGSVGMGENPPSNPEHVNSFLRPYGSQLNPSIHGVGGSQSIPVNPALQQPVVPAVDGVQPQPPSKILKQTQGSNDRQSRKSRHQLSVINKGRFTHERKLHERKTTTSTPKPTTTTTTTTTTAPTTTTTTPKPTTTTTTTPEPTTTTTTPKPTTTTTTTPERTTTTTTPKPTTTTTTTPKPTTTTTTTKKTTTTTTTTTTTPPTTTTRRTARVRKPKQSGVSFERVLSGCCNRGRQWAADHDTCVGIVASVGTYSQICSVAQEKCCIEAKNEQFCLGGMDTAQSLSACDVPANLANTCGANEFKMCCDCCEMGLKASSLRLSCDARLFGEQCNKAYAECCKRKAASEEQELPGSNATSPEIPTTKRPQEVTELVGPRCATHSTCQQVCDDTREGMVCSCRRGYRLHRNKRDCVDVNECVLNTHTCTEHQLCLNREGSFFCQRRISCGTGYELTEKNTCRDIDECELNIHDCLPSTDCDNIRGSYRCIPKLCDAGYITDATGKCIDIDECRTRAYTCPRGASCINTKGSYDCMCPIGLAPNDENTVCEDINECLTGSADCREGATCINTVGSFVCREPPRLRCAPGYEPNVDTRTCMDIDECTAGTHTCKSGSTCINEDGGFRCQDPLVCPEGMKPDGNGIICLDVNECDDPTLHRCDVGGICINLMKTFKCVCDSGYENGLTPEGLPTCNDINECDLSDGDSCDYKCRNLPGSYECFCPEGYRLGISGTTCEDIDECGAKESPCTGSETCFNTEGSHKCVDLSCPAGYTRTTNTRCVRQSCRGRPRSCLKQPKQISFHNISLANGTMAEKPLFRMSLARTNTNDRYEFIITDGNEEGVFKLKSSTRISRPTGVVYTAQELVGPKDYIIDLTLKLNRSRRRTNFVSRLYIFVGNHDL